MNNQSIDLNAKPQPTTIDITQTAILVIDMQNDFGTENGMFHRAGIDVSSIRNAINPISQVLDVARPLGIPIIYLKMGFKPDLSDLGSPDSVNRARHLMFGVGESVQAPDGSESRILVRDTWGTNIVDELAPMADDIVVYKHRYSGFYQTNLDEILKQLSVKTLVVTGCTTSVCVESTVRDAMFRDYSCVLLSDCMAEPIGHDFERGNHEATLMLMEMLFAWVSDSNKFIRACEIQVKEIAQ